MSTLADDLAGVLPATDPVTGDRLQLITHDDYVSIMGPVHASRFMHMASFHPDGDTTKPVVYDLAHFMGQFWPIGADAVGIIRWQIQPGFVDQFMNVTVYRRVSSSIVRTVMHVGESGASNTVRIALYDIGIRHIQQEVRAARLDVLLAMGAEHTTGIPNKYGRYEMHIKMAHRPSPGRHPFPPGMHLGRR